MDSSLRARQNAFEDPAKCAAQPDFDLGHAQQVRRAVVHPLQVDIVDADHFAAVDVDDLAVDQVPLQKEVVALVLEGRDRLGRAQFEGAGRGLHHFLRGHKGEAGARLEHQARHFAAIGSGGHRNIFELAAQLPLRIGHRRAEKRRQADAGCGAVAP